MLFYLSLISGVKTAVLNVGVLNWQYKWTFKTIRNPLIPIRRIPLNLKMRDAHDKQHRNSEIEHYEFQLL